MSQQEVVVGGVPMQFTFDDRDTDEIKENKIRQFLSTPEGQQSYAERQQAYQQSVASASKSEQMSKDIDDLMSDVKELKRMIFKAQYIMYGAIVVFVLMSDKFTEIFKLL